MTQLTDEQVERLRHIRATQDETDLSALYGVGGELYTFVHTIRSDLQMRDRWGMARRAQELLDKITAHDKEVDRIAREVTAECKAELSASGSSTQARAAVEAYRAGLRRAAKEVCDGCDNEEQHGPAHKIEGSTRWWHGEESQWPCEADGIHALLKSMATTEEGAG